PPTPLPPLFPYTTLFRSDRRTAATIPRQGLYLAQTPQVFRRDLLFKAYAQRSRVGPNVTDDCQLVEAIGHPCAVVEGSPLNLKRSEEHTSELQSPDHLVC